MGIAQSKFAYADMRRPQPWGVCDRCGFRYFHHRLDWQFDYRGLKLQNLRILVDHKCMDEPQPQLKPIIIGPDPYPVRDPRPGFAASQMVPVPAPALSFIVPTNGPWERTDQGEVIDDDQGNPILIVGPFVIGPDVFGLANDGGVLVVSVPFDWPVSAAGLAPGSLWTLGGDIFVVPSGVIPDPSAPAVFFNQIGAVELLALGGGNLPLSDPHVVNQIWNNDGLVCVSAG